MYIHIYASVMLILWNKTESNIYFKYWCQTVNLDALAGKDQVIILTLT